MHTASQTVRLRGGLAGRLSGLATGLLIFAAGIVALLEAQLGLSPWDVLHQGIARHTPLSFGEASIAVSVVILVLARALKARIGFGTIANAVLVGVFVQVLTGIDFVADLAAEPLAVRALLLGVGIVLMGAGTALYISADLGAGPRDSLMLVGAQRTGQRIGLVRAALELAALAIGFALGGVVGVGTVAFAVAIGPVVEAALAVLRRSRLREPAPGVPARPGPLNGDHREALQQA